MRRALETRAPLAISGTSPAAWRPLLELTAGQLGLTLVESRSLAAPRDARERSVVSPSALSASARASLHETLRGASALVLPSGTHASAHRPIDGRPIDEWPIDEWVEVRLPPLRERLEDLPWLVRGALREALGEVPEIDASVASRILLSEWPEDVEGLRRWAASVAQRPRQARLTWTGEDLAFAGGPRATTGAAAAHAPAPPSDVSALKVARDGSWFAAGDDGFVDLRTRYALARVLSALVRSRVAAPDATVSLDALVAAGWPGEKLLADSGANRVYVAIATLRRLGLRDVIERREGGYRLAPEVATELLDTPPRRHGAST